MCVSVLFACMYVCVLNACPVPEVRRCWIPCRVNWMAVNAIWVLGVELWAFARKTSVFNH